MTSSSDASDAGRQLSIAKSLLERGILTPTQLREVMADRGPGKDAVPLERLLVAKGIVTEPQIKEVLSSLTGPGPGGPPSSTAISPPPASRPPSGAPSSTFIPKLGKYTLTRELGRGGMGAVYEAVDTELNRKVALKLMITNPSADPKDVSIEEERFVREAQLAAKLKHPNIVAVHEAGVVNGRRFLAMELIQGKSFSAWRRAGSLTVRQQVTALRDVALAIHYAHEQGVLHRDLKPRNVLVDGDNHPFVTDFGLAKSLGKDANLSLTASGMVVGTPAYMSPEQCQGTGRVDWRSDIWSLGIMLYEILTGRTPYGGQSPVDIMTKVVRDPLEPPSRAAVDASALALDSAIENVCLKALAKDPKERYPTARAFADDLTKWISGQAVKVGAPKKARRSLRRILVETAVLFAILAAGGLAYRMTRPSPAADLERARSHMGKGEWSEAVGAYDSALTIDPDNEEARAGKAEAHRRIEERENRIRREIEEKLKEAERARVEAESKKKEEETARTEAERERIAAERRAAEERARAADAAAGELEKNLPGGLSSSSPSEEAAWKLAVNLLPRAQPGQTAQWGIWSLQGGRLQSQPSPHARIQIPFELPEEYDIRMLFSRLGGTGPLCLILSRNGSPFALELDASASRTSPFSFPSSNPNPGPSLANNRTYKAIVRVRRDGAEVFLDGRPAAKWTGDPAQMGIDPRWRLRDDRTPGLGSHGSSAAFSRLEILPVTGAGRLLDSEPAPIFSPPPTVSLSVQPGLIGEYFYGTSFDVLALRRIDPALALNCGENPAWPNGPRNFFSARWTGYFNAPKSGLATFTLTVDGAARLLVDGTQVLACDTSRRGISHSVLCRLERGLHPLVLEYSECGYRATVRLVWDTEESGKPAPIAPELLFHDAAAFEPYAAPAPPREFLGALEDHTNSVTCLSFSPDGRTLASCGEDGKIVLWDAARRRAQESLSNHKMGLLAVAFSPDGRLLASAGYEHRIKLWDAEKRTDLRSFQGHEKCIRSLSFSPDGRRIASGSEDRSIQIWDAATGREEIMFRMHEGACRSLAFSPDGQTLASASADHTVRLWDPRTGREIRRFLGHADAVESLAFSPDGRTLASCSRDYTIRLWDVNGGGERRVLGGHHGPALCVAFRPDGKILASGGQDTVIRLWDVATGDERRILAGHAGHVTALRFSPDGRTLASGSTDRTIRLWDLGPGGD